MQKENSAYLPFKKKEFISMLRIICEKKSVLLGVLVSQLSFAQSTVTVTETRFEGELGVPVNQLQEYTQFLVGRTLEKAKILADSERAVTEALRHRGFWKAQVKTNLTAASGAAAAPKGAVLVLMVHAGLQYRIKDVTFSGLASEFPPSELRECIHLRQGDIADGNEIGGGMANLFAIFRKKKLDYAIIPSMTFDDATHMLTVDFEIQK